MKGLSKILFYGMAAMVAAALFTSCFNEDDPYDPNKQLEKENRIIEGFLVENNLNSNVLIDSLYDMRILIHSTENSANRPLTGDNIVTDYILYDLDSNKYDSSYDRNEPLSFIYNSSGVILGFNVGFLYLQEGDSATFFVPSPLAYGPNQQGSIPPNTTLIFNVKFKSLN